MTPARVRAILDFWFAPPNRYRPEWFRADLAFATQIETAFGVDVEAALGGREPVDESAESVLSHILLCDAFPRIIFRGSPRAFAGAASALAHATALVSRGADKNLPPLHRWFVFLPFQHSESLLDQERSVALFAALRREAQLAIFDRAYDVALHHREVIARFGRFPERNAILGRRSTAEEIEFLGSPASNDQAAF